ncbi:MotE family protein [Sporosarcina sp. SAFN-010]|uniref:MotE family protein n=1 Tax=Sporosarcina sp. SAFN-010 TaxID=3387273 RepID=UPI003F7EEDE0
MKRKKNKTPDSFKEERKAGSFFQMLLAWFVIPLIFAIAVLLIIAKVADVNVVEKAKEWTASVPVLEQKKQDSSTKKDKKILEERVVAMKEELKQKEKQLMGIQEDLKKSNAKNEELVLAQEKLQAEILVLQRTNDESKKEVGQLVSTFEQMSAKSAAPVITEMDDAQALQLLSQMKANTLAAILEKMSAKDAAKYTALLAK